MNRPFYRREDRLAIVLLAPITLGVAIYAVYRVTHPPSSTMADAAAGSSQPGAPGHFTMRRNIRIEGDKQYLWAKGPRGPTTDQAEWFDLTDSPLQLQRFQYGIGRDSIPAIDQPVFVKPDDPRFLAFWAKQGVTDIQQRGAKTREPGGSDVGNLEVIGYEHNGVARAYPKLLLDHHELVNDTVGGKPVTVGW